jgi:hypothetical protein
MRDLDPALLSGGFQDANNKYCKILFFTFLLTLIVGTFTSVFKENILLISQEKCRSQGFFLIFLPVDNKIRIWIREA